MSNTTPLQRTRTTFRGGAQDHGTRGTFRDIFPEERAYTARFRAAREQAELDTVAEDLEAWANELLTEAGVTDLDLLDPDGGIHISESTNYRPELDPFASARLLEEADLHAAIAGDSAALERVLERAREQAADRYPEFAELGLSPTRRLRRFEFLDGRDPQEQLDLHDGLIGVHIVDRP